MNKEWRNCETIVPWSRESKSGDNQMLPQFFKLNILSFNLTNYPHSLFRIWHVEILQPFDWLAFMLFRFRRSHFYQFPLLYVKFEPPQLRAIIPFSIPLRTMFRPLSFGLWRFGPCSCDRPRHILLVVQPPFTWQCLCASVPDFIVCLRIENVQKSFIMILENLAKVHSCQTISFSLVIIFIVGRLEWLWQISKLIIQNLLNYLFWSFKSIPKEYICMLSKGDISILVEDVV